MDLRLVSPKLTPQNHSLAGPATEEYNYVQVNVRLTVEVNATNRCR
jgi:hypothetical protein